jgi:hypothetical protein
VKVLKEQQEAVRRLLIDEVLRTAVDHLGDGRLNDQAIQNQQIWALALRSGQGGRIDIGAGLVAFRDRERIVITTLDDATVPTGSDEVAVAGPGTYIFGRWRIDVSEIRAYAGDKMGGLVCLSGHPFPWTIRTAEARERYTPFGAPGSQTLKRLWCNGFMPERVRATAPVLHSARGVLCAAGLRVAESARARLRDPVVQIQFIQLEY